MSFLSGIGEGIAEAFGEAGAGTTGLGEAGTGAEAGESAAAGAKAEEGTAEKSAEKGSESGSSESSGTGPSTSTVAKAGGLAALLGVAGWQGLLVRALEAIAGFVLIVLGLVSMTGGPSSPAAAARKILP